MFSLAIVYTKFVILFVIYYKIIQQVFCLFDFLFGVCYHNVKVSFMSKYRLLLVCTGNTCRSPMLETLIKAELKSKGKECEVKSAGLRVFPEDKVNEKARKALKKYDLVIRHKPTQLEPKALERADSVLTMTKEQKLYLRLDKCYYKVFSLGEAVGFDIPDPYGQTQNEYDICASALSIASQIIVENLIKAGKI